MRSVIANFMLGLLLTLFAAAISLLVSLKGFRNPYYMSVLLPLFILLYLLLAWLMYLRRSGFMSGQGLQRSRTLRYPGNPTGELPEDKASGAEVSKMQNLRGANGLVRRKSDPSEEGGDRPYREAIAVLLWSACLLALLATGLYWFCGLGAKYY